MGGDVSNPTRMAEKQQILRFLEVKMLSLVILIDESYVLGRSARAERAENHDISLILSSNFFKNAMIS